MLYVVLGLVIAVIGGTVIEKLHLETQVQEFIRKANSIDIPQEKLTFKDRIKYAWEQVVETAKRCSRMCLWVLVSEQLSITGFPKIWS